VTNALLQTTRYAYDALGRLITVTDASGAVQRSLTYDAFDRIATSTDSEGYALSYTYDALDRVTAVIYPDTSRESFSYFNLDLKSYKNRGKPLELFGYDANRRLKAYMDGYERSTSFTYHNNGVLSGIKDSNGNRTTWDIDIQGRPTVRRYPDGTTENYAYEVSTSRLKSVTDARGQTKTYGYTADDLIKSLTYTGTVNPTPNVSFTYDPFFARRTSMSDGNGTTQCTQAGQRRRPLRQRRGQLHPRRARARQAAHGGFGKRNVCLRRHRAADQPRLCTRRVQHDLPGCQRADDGPECGRGEHAVGV
jgi:YD repeat-containing protein